MSYKNKKDQAKSSRKHYERNIEACKARARAHSKRYRERNREFLHDYLRNHFCVDCGEKDIRVLDFDHIVGEKRSDVTRMAHNCYSIKKIQEEIDKCAVRCSNCHRKKTMRALWRATQARVEAQECQQEDPESE